MDALLDPVGAKEAKNRFSELAAEVNRTGSALPVLKYGKLWVLIQPASDEVRARRDRLRAFRSLTDLVDREADNEPGWDPDVSDADLLGEERTRRFG